MANILISGAGGNLGKVVVDYFVSKGHTVLAIVSSGKSLSGTEKLIYYSADLTDEIQTNELVHSIAKEHKTLDAAILLAGGFAMGGIQESNWQAISAMIDVNFKTAFTVARPVFLTMLSQTTGGKIVFVGARPALDIKSGKAMLAYTLSKSIVLTFAELLNAEADNKPVQCSVIVPSTIDTPANRAAMPQANFKDWNKPEDIAVRLEKIVRGSTEIEAVVVL